MATAAAAFTCGGNYWAGPQWLTRGDSNNAFIKMLLFYLLLQSTFIFRVRKYDYHARHAWRDHPN
jgi:hypothetical protein